jgi:hypothetical protein
MYLLRKTCPNSSIQFLLGTEISINMFADEDWLECSISKDYPGGEEAVDNSKSDLYYSRNCALASVQE